MSGQVAALPDAGRTLAGATLRCFSRIALLSVDTDRVGSLDEALALLSSRGGRYRVAWLDLLGTSPGRGVVTRAEHLPSGTRHGSPIAVGGRAARRTGSGRL